MYRYLTLILKLVNYMPLCLSSCKT